MHTPRRYWYTVLAFASVLWLSGCCTPGTISSLAVGLRPQETDMWCWAASGEMIMDFLGTNVTQCDEANKEFGRSDCPCSQCTNAVNNPPCVNGGWPEFDKYGFTFKRTSNTALTWAQLQEELAEDSGCGKTPIAYSWHWSGGGGHMMVAHGYVTVNGQNFVAILDPWSPCVGDDRIITYAAYVSGSGYTHWDDFYDIRK